MGRDSFIFFCVFFRGDFYRVKKGFKRRKIPMGHDEDSWVVIFIICNAPDFSGTGRNSDGAQDPAGKAWILSSVFGRKSADSFHGFRPFLAGMQWNWREITGKIRRNPVLNTVAVFR
jgi:hypothetical protein